MASDWKSLAKNWFEETNAWSLLQKWWWGDNSLFHRYVLRQRVARGSIAVEMFGFFKPVWEDVRYCIQGKLENGFWQSQDGIGPDSNVFLFKGSGNIWLCLVRLVQCEWWASLSAACTLPLTLVVTYFLLAPGSSSMTLTTSRNRWKESLCKWTLWWSRVAISLMVGALQHMQEAAWSFLYTIVRARSSNPPLAFGS